MRDELQEQLQREIEAIRARLPYAPRGSKEAVRAVAGLWAGEPDELERLLQEVMREREVSLEELGGKPRSAICWIPIIAERFGNETFDC